MAAALSWNTTEEAALNPGLEPVLLVDDAFAPLTDAPAEALLLAVMNCVLAATAPGKVSPWR